MSEWKHGIYGSTSDAGPRPVTIAPTSFSVLIGTAPNADADAFPLDTPVLIAGDKRLAAKLDLVGDGDGYLPDAVEAVFDQKRGTIAVIRVEKGADDAATKLNIIGGVDGGTGVRSGMEALLDVQALLGLKPRLLTCEFSHDEAVLTSLLSYAARFRAMVYADCPGTTYSEAVAYKALWGDQRLELCWPAHKNVNGRTVPFSAFRLGIEIQKDQTKGEEYSASGSNRVIYGSLGPIVPIDYVDGDVNCLSHLLNFNRITTAIRDDGLRTWGNLTCAADPKWQFANAVRVNDVILSAIAISLKWARDKKLSKTFVEDVTETINLFGEQERKAANIYGLEAYADPLINTSDQILAGKFQVDYEFTPPGIAQELNVVSHFVNDFASVIFE